MKAVQPANSEPPGDRGVAQSMVSQLLATDNSVLPDNVSMQGFCVELCPTVGHKSTHVDHAATLPADACRRDAQMPPFIAEVVPSDANTQLVTRGTLTRL